MSVPIYVIGSSNTDLVVKSERLPRPGETVLGGTFFMNAGGKGANQAVAAARMGGHPVLVANIGRDVFGDGSIQHFKKENIDTSFITRDDIPSGVALILVDAKGENSISVAPGSNGTLDPPKVQSALSSVSGPGIVLLQMEIPPETVECAIKTGKSKGLTVILNPAPAQRLGRQLLSQLDFITPNETEAEMLTGLSVTDIPSATTAARHLLNDGVKNVVITLGPNGALLMNSHAISHVLAPKVRPVDTTAAGDCFNGALAVALSENKSFESAVRLACYAASISVTRLGAQTSMPSRNEVETLMTAP